MICTKLEQCMDARLNDTIVQRCDNDNVKCVESSDNRSEVKCEEKKKKYILVNTKRKKVISYKMDGGVVLEDRTVPHNTNKCDNLFVIDDLSKIAILIELKGVDVLKSLVQLKGTLELYKSTFKNFGHVYARAIVTSATTNIKATPEYVNLVKVIRQTYKGNVKIVERQFKERDIDLEK